MSIKTITLQGTNISHLRKRKIIFKMPFFGDMLVSWRVGYWSPLLLIQSIKFGAKNPTKQADRVAGVLASASDVGFQGDHKFHAF